MKAFVLEKLHEYPTLKDVDVPNIETDGQVIVQLKASALNHRDLWITQGLYPGIRIGAIMGADGCGMVGEKSYVINPGLSWGSHQAFQSSDFRVLGVPDDGTFADYISIDRKYLYDKPDHLSAVQAAALPLAGVTAFRAIMVRAALKKEDKVLISGIGGGVAFLAMQFALALGCEVYVTSGSESKIAQAIAKGAKGGFIYHDPDWPKKLIADAEGVNVVIDSACGNGFNQLVKVCLPGARIAFYGGTAGKIDGLNPQALFWKQISVLGSTMGSDADFGAMLDFVSEHKIIPEVDLVLPFSDIPVGFERMKQGQQTGKIVFEH